MTTLGDDGDSRRVRVRVPAKINTALCVGARAADGYHPLGTVFQAVSLYEVIDATARDDGRLNLMMNGEGSHDLPLDESNLAMRAAVLLRERFGDPALGIDLHIDKHVPMAGGMAGGSADGAGTLLACAECWGLDVTVDELAALAAELGSDVPFLLYGGQALGTGRGDRLQTLPSGGRLEWVFALAPQGLSTPLVYRRFDELADAGDIVPDAELPGALVDELCSGDPGRVAAVLRNDLQAAAIDLYPQLAETLAAGQGAGVLGALVCGSGPTCAFLCADATSADELADRLAAVPTVRSVRRASGPVGGPEIARIA